MFRSHSTMVKAVAVLGSSESVKGTIFFTQEGDGNLISVWLVLKLIALFDVHIISFFFFRSNNSNWKPFWPQAWSSWIPCSRPWGHNKWLHVNWYGA